MKWRASIYKHRKWSNRVASPWSHYFCDTRYISWAVYHYRERDETQMNYLPDIVDLESMLSVDVETCVINPPDPVWWRWHDKCNASLSMKRLVAIVSMVGTTQYILYRCEVKHGQSITACLDKWMYNYMFLSYIETCGRVIDQRVTCSIVLIESKSYQIFDPDPEAVWQMMTPPPQLSNKIK